MNVPCFGDGVKLEWRVLHGYGIIVLCFVSCHIYVHGLAQHAHHPNATTFLPHLMHVHLPDLVAVVVRSVVPWMSHAKEDR